jgi:hypothetical protein
MVTFKAWPGSGIENNGTLSVKSPVAAFTGCPG